VRLTDQERSALIAQRKAWREKIVPERPPSPHQAAISRLIERDPALSRKGMRQGIKRLPWEWDVVERDFNFIPDAWKIVDGELHCYEVVDGCGLTRARRAEYGHAWNAADEQDGIIRLFVCDPHGGMFEANVEQYFWVDAISLMAERRGNAEGL
jgi:hypothetical protein